MKMKNRVEQEKQKMKRWEVEENMDEIEAKILDKRGDREVLSILHDYSLWFTSGVILTVPV